MQIACKRFGCQKAVEVCYWTCKYRKNCKDWAGALEGQPGLPAITERLEMAAAKTGRVFEAKTLIKPVRPKRAVAAPALLSSSVKTVAKVAPKVVTQTVAKPAANGTHYKQRLVKLAKPERNGMAKLDEEKNEAMTEPTTPKSTERKPAPKPAKAKPTTNGPVYLLLSKNGKYRELREADLLKEAAHIIKDPSLRLVKGQFLVPQITFKSPDE